MAKVKKIKYQIDVMSITVLLVMTLFGGIVGYYLGMSAGANQILNSVQNVPIMTRTK